jgi:Flp pilus assembly pilin Flp
MSEFLNSLWVRVSNVLYREQGQAVTEYAILLVVIALIATGLYAAGVDKTIVSKITTSIGKI